jgi:hypothetical protein
MLLWSLQIQMKEQAAVMCFTFGYCGISIGYIEIERE